MRLATILPDAWEQYLRANRLPAGAPRPVPQPIEATLSDDAGKRHLLGAPRVWWDESDLEVSERAGRFAKIKPDAWQRFLVANGLPLDKPLPGAQPIVAAPAHPPYDRSVQLAWPIWWWSEAELEFVEGM